LAGKYVKGLRTGFTPLCEVVWCFDNKCAKV